MEFRTALLALLLPLVVLGGEIKPTAHIGDQRAEWICRQNKNLPEALRLTKEEAERIVAARAAEREALGYRPSRPYNTWHSFRRWTKGDVWENHRELFGQLPDGRRGVELDGFPPFMKGLSKICVSNPAVIERRIAEWKAMGCPEVLEGADDDGLLGFCRCAKCRALDADLPGERFLANKSDRYVDFWNRLTARAVAERPDVKVVVYLYAPLRHPPRREKIAYPDNMVFSYVPTYLDADPAAEIRAWKACGLRHFFMRPNYLAEQSALPIGREKFICDVHHALRGEGSTGDYIDTIQGIPAKEFEVYAATRLCADPTVTFETIEREWCARFGAAAETVRAYYARVRARCDREWEALLARHRREGVEYLDDGHYRHDVPSLHSLPELEEDLACLASFEEATLVEPARTRFAQLKVNAAHYPLVYRALMTKSEADKRRLLDYRCAHAKDLGSAWSEYWKKGEDILWEDTPAKRRYENTAVVSWAERFENALGRPDARRCGPLASLDTNRVESPLVVPFTRIGTLRPRNVDEISASNWTVGCETIERGYADFWQYADYLVPLGIKTIRVQAGWARCEPKPGKFEFRWLDEVIDFAIDNGLNVLLETSYGNPAYPGAGGWDLGAGFPTSAEGLAAWDRWVETLASRYKGKVRDWAMWNEPDIRNPANPTDAGEKTPEDIAAFNVRTAKIIQRVIPDARLAGLSLARIHEPVFFERCLKAMGEDVKRFTWFIHHGYAPAPESSYVHLDRLSAIVRKYHPTATMRQGENGCPSEFASRFALRGPAWSEYSQAKWDMRRMLGDLGHGFESSVFTICDFNHTGREINRKGLLRATSNHKVISVKRAYYAVQNVVSVFDDSVTRVTSPAVTNVDTTVVLNEYRTKDGAPLYVFWTCGHYTLHDEHTYKSYLTLDYDRPGDSFETRPTVLTAKTPPMKDPVWVDLLTGRIYAFPTGDVHTQDGETIYTNVPVYDSPCVLTERSAVLGSATVATGGDFPIGVRGQPPACEIVLPAAVTVPVRTAARELAEGVRRLTDVSLPVVAEGSATASRRIVLHLDDTLSESAFRLRVKGAELVIAGAERGLFYGVCELLERFGGVDWFTSSISDFPQVERFAVPASLDEVIRPTIAVRDTGWVHAISDPAFAAHLRINGVHFGRIKGNETYGGAVPRLWDGVMGRCHSFRRMLPVATYGKDHPEYYALMSDGSRPLGSRHGAQPCLTNPDVRRLLVETAVKRAKESEANHFGFSQNDCRDWCRCPTCQAINEKAGSDAGTLVDALNDVAQAVMRVRPDALVGTLAYHMTRNPPHEFTLQPNVFVEVCTSECDFSAPIRGNPNDETRRFEQSLAAWGARTRHLSIWDYTMNYRLYPFPMPNMRAFVDNVKLYRERGVFSVYAEGGNAMGWFGELKTYLLAKALWNPDRDFERLTDRFLTAFYGPAAPQAKAVLDLFQDYPRDRAAFPMTYADDVLSPVYPSELFETTEQLWGKAATVVAGCEPFAGHVAHARLLNDFCRVIRHVAGQSPKAVGDGRQAEMCAMARRILDYESAHPQQKLGWFWYMHLRPKVYALAGKRAPRKNAADFGELE